MQAKTLIKGTGAPSIVENKDARNNQGHIRSEKFRLHTVICDHLTLTSKGYCLNYESGIQIIRTGNEE